MEAASGKFQRSIEGFSGMSKEEAKSLLLQKLSEPGTITGLVSAFVTLLGWAVKPEFGAAIATIVSLVASVVLVYVKA